MLYNDGQTLVRVSDSFGAETNDEFVFCFWVYNQMLKLKSNAVFIRGDVCSLDAVGDDFLHITSISWKKMENAEEIPSIVFVKTTIPARLNSQYLPLPNQHAKVLLQKQTILSNNKWYGYCLLVSKPTVFTIQDTLSGTKMNFRIKERSVPNAS